MVNKTKQLLNPFSKNITRIEFFIFWCALLIQSLVWSRFLLSVSMWGIVIVALIEMPKFGQTERPFFRWLFDYIQFWHWKLPSPKRIGIWDKYKTRFLQKKVFIALTIPFFIVFLSGFWSENLSYWFSRVQLRLPFLLLPIAFSLITPLSKKTLKGLIFGFLIIISVNLLLILTNYALNFNDITKILGQGKSMPFLKEHTTFSIMAAFAFFIGIELWRDASFFETQWTKNIVAGLTLFLFVALHIIAVRTGIIALYICLILRGLIFIFESRRYLVGALGFALLFAIPLLSYQFLPSFQQKVNYAIWDFQQYKAGDPNTKSDSERIISLKIGTQIFLENKILGIGYGDIEQEMNRIYKEHYPNLEPKLPHNQWLLSLMGMGIVGCLFSIAAFLFPLFDRQGFKDFLFLSLNILIFVFSMTDMPFEATFSICFYVFFVCLFLNHRLSIHSEND